MHDYPLTGRSETDYCLTLANKAHNFYFKDPLLYKKEFVDTMIEFYSSIEHKFMYRTGESDLESALKTFFNGNISKYYYFKTELMAMKDRLEIIKQDISLINPDTRFILDYIARFSEVILPYPCSVKEEVEHHRKFSFVGIADQEFTFFKIDDEEQTSNSYLQGFYEDSWRAQKHLNGFYFIKNYLDLTNPLVKDFYNNYGGRDYLSSLMFSRMANERFMKYLSQKDPLFWLHLSTVLPNTMSEDSRNQIIADKDNEDFKITVPVRIDALEKSQQLNPLIAREAKLINARGNNIAHRDVSNLFSSCYHNLEVLNYLNHHCQ